MVTNYFQEFYGKASGKIEGYSRLKILRISEDNYEYHFETGEDAEAVRFELELGKETYNLFTDFSVMVLDQEDTFLENDKFTQRKLLVEFHPTKPGKYTLKILAGFTYPAKKEETWKVRMTEKCITREVVPISIKRNDSREFRLYPFLPVNLKFEMEHTSCLIPDGYSYNGFIEFQNIQDVAVATIPILIRKEP